MLDVNAMALLWYQRVWMSVRPLFGFILLFCAMLSSGGGGCLGKCTRLEC